MADEKEPVSLWAKFRGIGTVQDAPLNKRIWIKSLNLTQWTENEAHAKYKKRVEELFKVAKPFPKQ